MRKHRTDSRCLTLSATQRDTVEKWLFHEHVGYDDVVARIKTEFGVEISIASIGRYYRRRSNERQMSDLVEAQAMSDAISGSEVSTDVMRAAALKLIAKTALKIVWERPDRVQELESLAKILVSSEDTDIRRGRLKLEQEQFYYSAACAASEEIPKLARLLLKIEDDESLNPEAKLQKVRALLFPDSAPLDLTQNFDKNL